MNTSGWIVVGILIYLAIGVLTGIFVMLKNPDGRIGCLSIPFWPIFWFAGFQTRGSDDNPEP